MAKQKILDCKAKKLPHRCGKSHKSTQRETAKKIREMNIGEFRRIHLFSHNSADRQALFAVYAMAVDAAGNNPGTVGLAAHTLVQS